MTETIQEDALEGGDVSILNSLVGYALDIQGLPMDVDLYVLPRKGSDIVIGIQWLENLGEVTHDYLNQTMKFSWLSPDYALKGEEHVVNLLKDKHEGQPVE
nr:hypothetical protein [Tanacetum cinerariifolium]